MPLTCVMAHAPFSTERQMLLPSIVESWEGGCQLIVTDDTRRGAWPTVRAAWHEALRLSGGEGHLAAIQDDYLLARGGFSFMQEVCEVNPDRVLCFRWAAENERWLHLWADRDDAFWAFSSHAWTGGALAVPAPIVERFLKWSKEFDANLTRLWRHGDDSRFELFCMSQGIEIVRCRWSFLRHLGKWSVCRSAERDGDDEELGLIADVADVPPLTDPRWVVSESNPSAVYVPDSFKRLAHHVLGPNHHKVDLGPLQGE